MLCGRQVMLLERCRFWGSWDVEWSIDVDAILGVPAVHDGKLIFKVKQVGDALMCFCCCVPWKEG